MKRSASQLSHRNLLLFPSCKQSLSPKAESWREPRTSHLAFPIDDYYFYPSTPQILVVTSDLILWPHRADTSVLISHRMNFKKTRRQGRRLTRADEATDSETDTGRDHWGFCITFL